jgi:hypothetical protein
LGYIAGAEPEPYQHQDDRTIAKASRGAALTDSDETIDLLGREAPGQGCQTPMRERRDSLIEVGGTQAPKAEITQESPQRSDQLLSGAGPALSGLVEHELPYLLRIPTAGVCTQCVEQSTSATAI